MKNLKRMGLIVAVTIICISFVNMPSRAGSIVYTWNEDDGQAVTGTLIVGSEALQNGQFQFADVQSFSLPCPSTRIFREQI